MKTSRLLAALLLTTMGASAQTAYQIGFGNTATLDTYLSQEKFSGGGITLLQSAESGRQHSLWTWRLEQQLNLSLPEHSSTRADEIEGAYGLFVGRYHSWTIADNHLRLQAGLMANATVGFIYLTQNSNNPAQARLSLMLMPAAAATARFAIRRRHHFAVRYETRLPLAGMTFSPNYGQSYYEIFNLGNYDHNIVPTTFISAPYIQQQLNLGYHLGRSTMVTIGYLGDYQQLSVNNLKQHVYSHRIMLGLVKKVKM